MGDQTCYLSILGDFFNNKIIIDFFSVVLLQEFEFNFAILYAKPVAYFSCMFATAITAINYFY